MGQNRITEQVIQKMMKFQIYTYPSGDVTVTGTDGSATATICPNNTIVVEAALMNNAATITLKTPIAFKLLRAQVLQTSTNNGGCTLTLKNNTDSITDAVDVGSGDTKFIDSSQIDDAYDAFAIGDNDLVLTFAATEASTVSTNSCRVIIFIQPN